MRTLLTTDADRAGALIREGRLVAFPTETVFGLGADAGNPDAVSRIFEAKGRPSDNPLIVHVWHRTQIGELVAELSPPAVGLMDAFFPGPLTLVVPRARRVPDVVTAGLDTVAVRMPDHPVARAFLRAAGRPVAAPSANRSGRPSPTTWQAVEQDLGGRIDAILKGGPTRVGLESTVVDCTLEAPLLLRHGSITLDDVRLVAPAARASEGIPELDRRSPGTRHRHYQPDARVVIGEPDTSDRNRPGAGGGVDAVQDTSTEYAWIGLDEPSRPETYARIRIVDDQEDYARSLFAFFRECEEEGIAVICCQPVADIGLGRALMDRLRRAAG